MSPIRRVTLLLLHRLWQGVHDCGVDHADARDGLCLDDPDSSDASKNPGGQRGGVRSNWANTHLEFDHEIVAPIVVAALLDEDLGEFLQCEHVWGFQAPGWLGPAS